MPANWVLFERVSLHFTLAQSVHGHIFDFLFGFSFLYSRFKWAWISPAIWDGLIIAIISYLWPFKFQLPSTQATFVLYFVTLSIFFSSYLISFRFLQTNTVSISFFPFRWINYAIFPISSWFHFLSYSSFLTIWVEYFITLITSFWNAINFSSSLFLTQALSFFRFAIKVITVFYSLLIYVLIITIICISLFILISSTVQFPKTDELTLIFVVLSYFDVFWHFIVIVTFLVGFWALTSTEIREDHHLFRSSIFLNSGEHSLFGNIMCQYYQFLFSSSFHFSLCFLSYLNLLFIWFVISNPSCYSLHFIICNLTSSRLFTY